MGFNQTLPTPASPYALADDDDYSYESKLTQDDINKCKQEIFKRNEFELIETETRNVLFLGKTRYLFYFLSLFLAFIFLIFHYTSFIITVYF